MSKHFKNDENENTDQNHENVDNLNDEGDDWYSKKSFFNDGIDDMFNDDIEF